MIIVNIMFIIKCTINIFISDFTFPSAMEVAHNSTMGFCIDDIKDDKLLEELVIATYHRVSTTTFGNRNFNFYINTEIYHLNTECAYINILVPKR